MNSYTSNRCVIGVVLISAVVLAIGSLVWSSSAQAAANPVPFVHMRIPFLNSGQGKMTPVKQGTWGGQSISFTVEPNAVLIEFDCAEGSIPKQLKADKKGYFKVQGTFTRHSMGPVRRDNMPKPELATYEGTIKGDVMTLKIWLVKTKESAGEFKIERGKTPKLFRCA